MGQCSQSTNYASSGLNTLQTNDILIAHMQTVKHIKDITKIINMLLDLSKTSAQNYFHTKCLNNQTAAIKSHEIFPCMAFSASDAGSALKAHLNAGWPSQHKFTEVHVIKALPCCAILMTRAVDLCYYDEHQWFERRPLQSRTGGRSMLATIIFLICRNCQHPWVFEEITFHWGNYIS